MQSESNYTQLEHAAEVRTLQQLNTRHRIRSSHETPQQLSRQPHSDQREAGHGSDAALVVAVPSHQDVSVHAPAVAPRVLDDPEVLGILSRGASVAHNQNAVIDAAGAAVGIIVHSALVGREARPGGVDTDRDRTCGETGALLVRSF